MATSPDLLPALTAIGVVALIACLAGLLWLAGSARDDDGGLW